jgi:cell division transport system permease protein
MKNWQRLLVRSFREGSIQIWRNKFLSGTTILLGALILFLLNFVFSIQFFADYSIKNLESRADFSVVLQENFDAFEFEALRNELKKFNLVTNLRYSENINQQSQRSFPPRLHIKFDNITHVEQVFDILKKPRYNSVIGNWDTSGERDFVMIIGKLLRVRNGVNNASFWLIVLFLAGGILLAFNTFRIVLFSRKDEVFIARFVGAKPRFIAGPFLVEGGLLGIISCLLALILFVLVLRQIEVLPGGAIFLHLWNNVFSFEILCAGLVGIIGAWIAVRKYLKGTFIQ